MKISNTHLWCRRGGFSVSLVLGLLYGLGTAVGESETRLDPAKFVGPDECAQCHKSSFKVWKETNHFKTFRRMHKTKKAKKIRKSLGLKSIKGKNSPCLACHYTSIKRKKRPIAGISCESCHGASRDWIRVHSDFGGQGAKREDESTADRRKRYAKSETAGMIRPVRLYELASRCFGCHTVADEKLVNSGGHPAGSKFELVSWSQGEVRHNTWYRKGNPEAAPERKRMMLVVGGALGLEFALRGLAKATQDGIYFDSMIARANGAVQNLKQIADRVSAPEIVEILAIAKSIEEQRRPNNANPLKQAAEKISALAQKIAEKDGSGFGAIDPLVPRPTDYKGKPAQVK